MSDLDLTEVTAMIEMANVDTDRKIEALSVELDTLRGEVHHQSAEEWQALRTSSMPALAHPTNPLEVFDNTVGTEAEESFSIDVVAGPGGSYDGWKLWKDLRVRYFEGGQKAIYAYRCFELIDLWGRTTKVEGATRVLVVQAEPK